MRSAACPLNSAEEVSSRTARETMQLLWLWLQQGRASLHRSSVRTRPPRYTLPPWPHISRACAQSGQCKPACLHRVGRSVKLTPLSKSHANGERANGH